LRVDILIHRLKWEIKASNQKEATSAQREVSLLMNNADFLRKLEERLKRISANDDFTGIKQLELDLGQLTTEQWAKNLDQKVVGAFAKAMLEKVRIESNSDLEKKTMKQYVSELFLDFVQTGTVSASAAPRVTSMKDWGMWLAEVWQKEALAEELKSRIRQDEEVFRALVRWPLMPVFKPLRQIVGRASSRIQLIAEIDAYLTKLGSEFVAETQQFRKVAWIYLLDDTIADDITIQAAQDVLMNLSYEVPRGKVKKLQEYMDALKKTIAGTQYSQVKKKQRDELLKPLPEAVAKLRIEDQLHIANAGLVLCAPFLQPFFINTAIGNKKAIEEPEVALALLSYLASGMDKEVPVDLALPKLLCGIPLNEPVVPVAPLAPKLKREAEALLAELIEHWKALKNTSPDGLREGFLQRQGILRTVDVGQKLQVETKAQDVLLAQLPWSISIIKLPWMKSPLHVDWA
jgi:hypothetical protein